MSDEQLVTKDYLDIVVGKLENKVDSLENKMDAKFNELKNDIAGIRNSYRLQIVIPSLTLIISVLIHYFFK